MKRILVAYATMAGSTAEIAEVVGEEIACSGLQVDVWPIGKIESLDSYDAVVVGGPMIVGWHRQALRFVKRFRETLQRLPWAVFVTAISLTDTGEASVGGVSVTVDPELPRAPEQSGRLKFKERYARLSNYLRPVLRAARPSTPASVGVFGGRLEYGRLKWWAVLFVMLVIQAPARDRRNWPAIRGWAAGLPSALQLQTPENAR